MCERNSNQLPLTRPQLGTGLATQACALTGNRTSDLLVCRPVLNLPRPTSQGRILIFEPHWKRNRERLEVISLPPIFKMCYILKRVFTTVPSLDLHGPDGCAPILQRRKLGPREEK